MENILTIVGSTVLVFTVTEFLKWILKKIKSRLRRKRKEKRRAISNKKS